MRLKLQKLTITLFCFLGARLHRIPLWYIVVNIHDDVLRQFCMPRSKCFEMQFFYIAKFKWNMEISWNFLQVSKVKIFVVFSSNIESKLLFENSSYMIVHTFYFIKSWQALVWICTVSFNSDWCSFIVFISVNWGFISFYLWYKYHRIIT